MREILFRGQTRRKGEKVRMDGSPVESNWVYGGVLCGSGDHSIIYQTEPDIEKKVVYTDTLGQFTGLTDKNGVKIFEGDILQGDEYPYCSDGEYNYYAEVIWFDDGCCGFGLCTCKNPKSAVRGISDGNCEWFEDFESDNWSVIGNIYDNPELIGEDGDTNG